MERDVSVRVTGKTRCAIYPQPAQDERLAGPEWMTVDTQPDPSCRREGRDSRGRGRRAAGNEPSVEKGSGAIEVEWNCHFEVGRFAADCMDRDSTGLQQRGFVCPGLGAVRRVLRVGPFQETAADTLRRLGGHYAAPVDGNPNATAVEPLESLRDGHDRDRGPVAGSGFRYGAHEVRAGQGPRGIVDEQDRVRVPGGVLAVGRGPRSSAPCGAAGPGRGRRRQRVGQRRDAGRDGLLASLPAGDHRDNRVRQPRLRGHLGEAIWRGDDDNAVDPGSGQRFDRPAEH